MSCDSMGSMVGWWDPAGTVVGCWNHAGTMVGWWDPAGTMVTWWNPAGTMVGLWNPAGTMVGWWGVGRVVLLERIDFHALALRLYTIGRQPLRKCNINGPVVESMIRI